MNKEISDYEVGLSPGIRNDIDPAHICALVERFSSGDPGDTDDITELMESISSIMDERPQAYIYSGSDTCLYRIIAMTQPKYSKILMVKENELNQPSIQAAIRDFGFNSHTLKPLEA